MIRHILVAVGPSFSEAALSVAINRARRAKARLTVLHVIDETPWWSGPFAESACDTRAITHQLALAIRGHSEKMLRDAGIEADWRTRTRDGRSVARVIADIAALLGADLVVLGTRRRGLLALGIHHVRAIVSRHARCDVLIATDRAPQNARVIEWPTSA
ncbi:Universal stress protein family [Candidatus Burkholderia verschuerenii]|uniref:Universal stress protein family n=1 Tax=Candidatus Burkholderia verschuerenii TaxID=242163 RepID=A0A0L0MI46_9BURK|nr:universal stress protein [Candidatus Burkholderia verschuerenii]KND61986.1 Universal stress protein family [Candidatus Burkholderia verschuerenii]